MNDYTVVLQGIDQCKTLNELSNDEKAVLANYGSIVKHKKGDVLFSFEDKGDAFYIVVSGFLNAHLHTNVKKKYKPGQLLGEVSIFAGKNRTGSVRVSENATLIKFEKEDMFNVSLVPIELQLKLVLCLTRSIVEYFYEMPVSILELIKKGESETLEFKENIHEKNPEKILQTVAGMCNHKGGTILIGVKDDGKIVGTDFDEDKLMKDIESMAVSRTGSSLLSMTHIFFDIIEGKKVLRIECEPSENFIFWRHDGKTSLFVRANAVNRELDSFIDVASYMQKRYKQNK